MTYSTLLTERTGPVLKITTNRPDVLNAQSQILLEELDDAFNAAVDDKDVRVIILAGAGKHFSAGHDLGSPQEIEDQKRTPLEPGFRGEYRRIWERFFENTMRWRDLPKPTIAQVQGYCIMGGMMIASACDIIVASEDAQFADRAVHRWQGGAHIQYFSMPWELGPRKAKEFLFTGDFFSAAEAEKAGLVNRVVPRAKLEEETMALAQKIAERDPFALKLAKASVNETQDAQGLAPGHGRALFKNYMLDDPALHRRWGPPTGRRRATRRPRIASWSAEQERLIARLSCDIFAVRAVDRGSSEFETHSLGACGRTVWRRDAGTGPGSPRRRPAAL